MARYWKKAVDWRMAGYWKISLQVLHVSLQFLITVGDWKMTGYWIMAGYWRMTRYWRMAGSRRMVEN